MSTTTITIPKKRVGNDIPMDVTLTISGTEVNWNNVSNISAKLYSESQSVDMGNCIVSGVDSEDNTILQIVYPGYLTQYVGKADLIVSGVIDGTIFEYDIVALEFVATASEEGTTTVTVEESSSGIECDIVVTTAEVVQTTGQSRVKVMSQKAVTDAINTGTVSDVKVNGTSVVTNKVAAVTVPTKTSDLTNDSGFITDAAVHTAIYGTTTFATMKGWLDNGNVVRCVMGSDSDMIGYVTYYSENKIHFLASGLDSGGSGELGICVVAKGNDGEADVWTYGTLQPENQGNKVDTIGASPSSAKYPSEYCLAQVAAGKADASAVAAINAKIPSQATSSNQLADKDFVNSSIQTATAEFKGTYDATDDGWTKIIRRGDGSTEGFDTEKNWNHGSIYASFGIGQITWSGNTVTIEKDDGSGNLFSYTFQASSEAPEIDQTVTFNWTDSLITIYAKIHYYKDSDSNDDYYQIFIKGSSYVAWIEENAFVYPDGTDMEALSMDAADNNDYMFFAVTDGSNNTQYQRYKYNGSVWSWEYNLNTTGFTAAQWAAVNSGATASNIAAIAGKYTLPSGGIPSTDMTSAVQTSLGKADTALQSHQDISGKADKVTGATNGNFAGLDSNGNLTDSGMDADDFDAVLELDNALDTIIYGIEHTTINEQLGEIAGY